MSTIAAITDYPFGSFSVINWPVSNYCVTTVTWPA
jgi:hypothetical protein